MQMKGTPPKSLNALYQSFRDLQEEIERSREQACVMVIDIVGYTSFVDRHGDLQGRMRIQTTGEMVLPVADRHGGRAIKGLGDGWLLVFSSPIQATQAAVEMQRRISAVQVTKAEPIQLKIGLNHGPLLEERDDIYGDVVNVSSRLASSCSAGDILLSQSVHETLDPFYQQRCEALPEFRIRGKSQTSSAYRIHWEKGAAEPRAHFDEKKLVLEIIWNDSESRITLKDSTEKNRALSTYDSHPLDMEGIEEASQEILSAIRSANLHGGVRESLDTLEDRGKRLFNLLFPEDLHERLRSSHAEFLLLNLDDACVHVPWELAHDGVGFLCCRFSIGRVARTRQATGMATRSTPLERVSFLVLSNPREDLPAASEEGREIYDLCQSDSRVKLEWMNGKWIDSSVQERLPEFDIVHYCGHADYSAETPDESGWILSEGRITALNLRDLTSQENPAPLLVFNNACHSGTSSSWKTAPAGWSFDLANAFLLAGCSHYIGAASELLDTGSKGFAKAFYQHLIGGHPIGRALRLARLEHSSGGDRDCLTWAQYVLYGDPESPIFCNVSIRPSAAIASPGLHYEKRSWGPVAAMAAMLVVLLLVAGVFLSGDRFFKVPPTLTVSTTESGGGNQGLSPPSDSGKALDMHGALAKINPLLPALVEITEERIRSGDKGDRATSLPFTICLSEIEAIGNEAGSEAQVADLEIGIQRAFETTDPFVFVPRASELEGISAELILGATSLADPSYRLAPGQWLPVVYLLTGKILRLGDEWKVYLKAENTVFRLSNVSAVASGTGELSAMANDLVTQLAESIRKNFPMTGRVVSSTTDSLELNIGFLHGVREKQVFDVYPEERQANFADSFLDSSPVARIEVTAVDNRRSFATVLSATSPVSEKMRVHESIADEPETR